MDFEVQAGSYTPSLTTISREYGERKAKVVLLRWEQRGLEVNAEQKFRLIEVGEIGRAHV